MISDKLFLAWNCHECAMVKMHVSKSMFEEVAGKDGQILTVIHTFSNNGTKDVLAVFGLEDYHAPVLLTHNKKIIADHKEIISYLYDNGLALDPH